MVTFTDMDYPGRAVRNYAGPLAKSSRQATIYTPRNAILAAKGAYAVGRAVYSAGKYLTRGRRPTAPAKAKAAAKTAAPKTQGSQIGYKSKKMSLSKPMSRSKMTSVLVKSSLENVIYRWNGVKAFSGNGNYWMQNRTVTGIRFLPWYMMDLTAINNTIGATPTFTTSVPMIQLRQDAATGNMFFSSISGYTNNGTTATTAFRPETAPQDITSVVPFGKSMLISADIQANLWGATAKATKFLVQIVRISDEDLVPDHNLALAGTEVTLATPKRNDFYQSMIKPYTFNPISKTGGIHARKFKVLKTQTITIEPNPTTDGDTDPQCVVYKAFLKLNKIMKYEDTAQFIKTDADLNDQADYAENLGAQLTTQVAPKSRIYLVIRSTNYGADAGDTNVNTPSFDLSVRVKHTISK